MWVCVCDREGFFWCFRLVFFSQINIQTITLVLTLTDITREKGEKNPTKHPALKKKIFLQFTCEKRFCTARFGLNLVMLTLRNTTALIKGKEKDFLQSFQSLSSNLDFMNCLFNTCPLNYTWLNTFLQMETEWEFWGHRTTEINTLSEKSYKLMCTCVRVHTAAYLHIRYRACVIYVHLPCKDPMPAYKW